MQRLRIFAVCICIAIVRKNSCMRVDQTAFLNVISKCLYEYVCMYA